MSHEAHIPCYPPVLFISTGHGDLCLFGKRHAGCVELLHKIQQRVKPKYHVFGHIHEGRNHTEYITTTTETQI